MGNSTRLSSQRGSTLVYVLVMIAGLSVFAMSFNESVLDIHKQILTSQRRSNFQYDISQMIHLMRLQNGLTESAGFTGNTDLYQCIKGGICLGNQSKGFYYLDPSDPEIDLNKKRKLAGPPDNAINFNENGSYCVGDPATCAYSFSSSFVAVCPGMESSCTHAEHLKIKIKMTPKVENLKSLVFAKAKEFDLIYFVSLNYKPAVMADDVINMYLADGEKEFSVTGDPGHPSEIQNFIFTECQSENATIFEVTTPANQPFNAGVAKIRLRPMAEGLSKLDLQINDGGTENNISDRKIVLVSVYPGSAP